MAVRLLAYEVADLCLGKPPLRPLSISATVADALSALKASDDSFISVWSCDHSSSARQPKVPGDECRCVGKVCMVDIICYLCKDENLSSPPPSSALKSPVSVLLPKASGLVRHLDSSSSLLEAIDLIIHGAQNLVIPIKTNPRRKLQKSSTTTLTAHNGREFCWLTQEDVIRFLLSSIGLFSPIPARSIDALGIISTSTTQFFAVGYYSPASAAIDAISNSLAEQTSVAVVDADGILIGEISPSTLACCDETAAAAIATLSAGELMAYIDGGGPPEDLARVVNERLKEMKLEEFSIISSNNSSSDSVSSSSSSDEESSPSVSSRRCGRYSRSSSYSARMVRQAEAMVCHPGSSLVAVMIQAIAHRVNYVWVIEDDCSLVGIVTFSNMLEVFYEHLQSMAREEALL